MVIKPKFPFDNYTKGRLSIRKSDGRKDISLTGYKGGKILLYARYLLCVSLGRELGPDECVDHIDENRFNDDISNLQVLSRSDNAKKSHVFKHLRVGLPPLISIKNGRCVECSTPIKTRYTRCKQCSNKEQARILNDNNGKVKSTNEDLLSLLTKYNGKYSKACKELGLSRNGFKYRLKVQQVMNVMFKSRVPKAPLEDLIFKYSQTKSWRAVAGYYKVDSATITYWLKQYSKQSILQEQETQSSTPITLEQPTEDNQMKTSTCIACLKQFESPKQRTYCDSCLVVHREIIESFPDRDVSLKNRRFYKAKEAFAMGRDQVSNKYKVEVVHHCNQNNTDNRFENLVIMDDKDHDLYTKLLYLVLTICKVRGYDLPPNYHRLFLIAFRGVSIHPIMVSREANYELDAIVDDQYRKIALNTRNGVQTQKMTERVSTTEICHCGGWKGLFVAMCGECAHKIKSTTCVRPSREVLLEDFRTKSYAQMASKYKVSDFIIRTWLKHYYITREEAQGKIPKEL